MAKIAPQPTGRAAHKAGFEHRAWLEGAHAARLALALGTAALPLGVVGWGFSTPWLTGLSGAALLIAVGIGGLKHMHDKKRSVGYAMAASELIENLKDGVIQFDAAGKMMLCSPAVERILGCAGYELEATGLTERVHVLDRPLFLTSFAAAQKDGVRKTIQIKLRRDESGTKGAPNFIWVELFLSPNRRLSGQISDYAITLTIADITQRKQSEQQLREVQSKAEATSQAKNQFLAVIGHELRTPLNAIVGFSDLMANGIGGTLGSAHLEYVQLISQSGHHLLEIVNMLLDKSKIDAGRFELQAERFEPEKLVGPCVQIVAKAAREKNVELDVQLGKSLPEILADERACRQILINLLSNAVKFTEAGGRVSWTMKRRGAHLAINVSDTGIGMSEDVVARLGETFFQAQNSADRHFEGTGLGISIVKGLVDLHGGSLHVQSRAGEGTSVDVLLPINGPETKMIDSGRGANLHEETPRLAPQRTSEPSAKRTA